MFLGHYGLAMGAKRFAPKTSLGTLILAAELADQVWPFFLLAGWETVKVVPGLMAASPFDFTSFPFTHSLLAELLAGIAFAAGYYLFRRDTRGALVTGILVPTHWLLDFFVHRPDLPLWPGGPRFGLGGWNSIPLTVVLEASFFAAGIWLYLRSTEAIDRTGRWALRAMCALLAIVYGSSLLGSPDTVSVSSQDSDTHAIAYTTLSLWLLVPWGYWIDRHRRVRS